ncbi:hypothetical protein DFH11DRAFT_1688413 [Phellopilus nigrolimitatus]|nr:hypothetical protein DFH11DRAFT_1688413 [Phellopilus nigrolimitatus]
MAPKNKGKKGKKQDDDFWADAGEPVAGNNLTDVGGVPKDDAFVSKNEGSSGFAALGIDPGDVDMENEEDFGGLMAAIQASSAKGKKEKKKSKKGGFADTDEVASVSFANGPRPGEGSDTEAAAANGDISAPKKAPMMTADELANEEWGPVKEKGGKKKKGKKGKVDAEEDEQARPPGDTEELKKSVAIADDLADDDEPASEPGAKVLSKKEKEKLKKEREKMKKKAQAAAKKGGTTGDAADEGAAVSSPAATAAAVTAEEAKDDEDDEDGAGAAAGGKSDKKKKKKKAKKEDEPAPAPAAGKKKGASGISALKAMMEEKRRIEEEARLKEEEERKRIEEEERKAEEEAKRREEEKARKKEKEKQKREQAKKEGRLLTKKQKDELAAAKRRKEALLASGVLIEGLQHAVVDKPKKVVYASRKKKSGPAPKDDDISSTVASTPTVQSPVVKVEELPDVTPAPALTPTDDGVKDEWDAESEKEDEKPVPAEDVKSDWDASSSDEEKNRKPSKLAEKPAAKGKSFVLISIESVHLHYCLFPVNGAATPAKKDPKKEKIVPAPASTPPKAPVAKAAASTKAPVAAPTKTSTKQAEPDESESESESEGSSSECSSDEDSSEEDSSSEEEMTNAQRLAAQRKVEAAERRAKAHEAALANRNKDDLRSPICCILGHVDTGKTKLLDKIRQTNVQEGEAGGITQQIGATYFPVDAIKTKTLVLNKDGSQDYKIPGLLVIDTPGHESFTNLRSRGSSLCNIAILVVDIMHGLEPQTLESLRLLRDRKTPFIVALNKIDRLYGWEATPDGAFRESLAKQKPAVQREFDDRVQKTILAFAEQGLNSVLYYENKSFARNVSLVPTSAITGEGVPDMIMLLVNLTQQRMSDRLMYLSELECTVLEVKVIEGLGTTIDVVLSNGILHEGDRIVVCGLNGPIVTQIRALLTPQPLRELRIKSQYVHHKEVKAALGVKISAPDLEKAIAGSRLLVVGPDDDEDDLRDEVMSDLTTLLNSIDKSGRGVCVQASTLGSLEALLDFLGVSKIPVSGINIGPVHKKDVMRCATVLEKAKELACILCFDVTVDRDAERLADELGIKLFKADIIYHLFDAFTAYNAEIMEAKRKDAAPQAIWPCRLKTIACFAKRDPIILGVDILDGTLRVGTPLCVVKVDPVTQKKEIVDLGKITSLEINHKSMDIVKKSQAGGGVAVKIEHAVYQSAKMFGRHFDDKDDIISHITRASIDVLKTTFKTDVSMDEWHLIKALKPVSQLHIFISKNDAENASSVDSDELQLQNLGYKPQLHRTWHQLESFAASFCALNFIGGVRSAFFLGLLAGGPAAIWSSYIITIVFMMITAAVLAEICSALPLSGSIYIWAAESAGPKYARFFGFVVAWWSCTAWMTFAAGNCQTTANYIVSLLTVFEVDFPGGLVNDNIKWRAFIWAVSEAMLLVSIAINYLPPRMYSAAFKFSILIMMVDFFLCVIWLPIGVSKTFGFRSAKDVFTMTYNGTGAPAGWNWLLSFLFTAGTLTGFDASGHIAEETKNASVVAGRGILSSAFATGILGFITAILFLFCTPNLDVLFALEAPQPFVQIYAMALGKGGCVVMTIIAVIGLIMNTSMAIVAASRLVFAVARDGVLPFSGWIGQVSQDGQPRHAVTVMFVFAAAILCTILPSQVAFTSLISAGGVPTIAAYGLIALLRLTMTPNHFRGSHFGLGRFAKPFYISGGFPVTGDTFNFSVVIFGAVTIFGILSFIFTPEEKWLPREQILQALNSADGAGERTDE